MSPQFELTEITTRDKLVHQGIFKRPKRPTNMAILWIHGLTGKFYGDLEIAQAFVPECEKNGWGFASFNNRGHDLLTSIHKLDARKRFGSARFPSGSGREIFEDCTLDIDAAIQFLVNEGFHKTFVAGISTGANKICYYAAKKRNPHLAGVILVSPMSDRLSKYKNKNEIAKKLKTMAKLVRQGKGNQLVLDYYFPITPNRFLSLHQPNTPEDCFDYGDKKPKMTLFSRIKKPLMVVFAGSDEHSDWPVEKIKAVFDVKTKSSKYQSLIIPAASHTYVGKEKQLVTKIANWISGLRDPQGSKTA